MDPPWHTTNMFVEDAPNPVPAYFLTKLVQRLPNLADSTVQIAYPNFGVLDENGGESCVIFHHGHLVEPLYRLVSNLRVMILESEEPRLIGELEGQNFAWIDFFWSMMGRSGEASRDIELIYEKIRDGEQRDKFILRLADRLAEISDMPYVNSRLEDNVYKWVMKAIARKACGERGQTGHHLSRTTENGLRWYMEGPLREQILAERKEMLPSRVSFVFGHTHKPFQERMNLQGYTEPVDVHNTGGWVVETTRPEPIRGGAITLIDEELNITSLRMYCEARNMSDYSVRVGETSKSCGSTLPNPLSQEILDLVDPAREPWSTFSGIAAYEVSQRARVLGARIARAML